MVWPGLAELSPTIVFVFLTPGGEPPSSLRLWAAPQTPVGNNLQVGGCCCQGWRCLARSCWSWWRTGAGDAWLVFACSSCRVLRPQLASHPDPAGLCRTTGRSMGAISAACCGLTTPTCTFTRSQIWWPSQCDIKLPVPACPYHAQTMGWSQPSNNVRGQLAWGYFSRQTALHCNNHNATILPQCSPPKERPESSALSLCDWSSQTNRLPAASATTTIIAAQRQHLLRPVSCGPSGC